MTPIKVMIIKVEKIIGKINAISISKTKKITATSKNFIQKGNRVRPVGSKPHSKGLLFSPSFSVLKVKVFNTRKNPPTNLQIVI